MLFNYRYVNNSIERLQGYLDHLVKEVWCQASGAFSLDLLHPELQEIVEAVADDESIVKDHLDGPIRGIYELFEKRLTAEQRQQMSKWYDHNNDIEALCKCNPNRQPATYTDIRAISADLEAALKEFCKNLFTDVIHLKAVTSRIGDIDQHYEAFITENNEGKCPYCGYGDIKGLHRTRREAYDHFLPKGMYPFNSVNFRNLAPMCNECNSSYKRAKDPTRNLDPISRRDGRVRRKAFYSYAIVSPGITIAITLKTKDIAYLRPENIDFQFITVGREEEVEAWKDIFGIEERYRDKLCSKNEGKAWLGQIVEESENGDLTRDQLLALALRAADRSPYDSANFLKRPFLTACKNAKII